MQPKYSNDLLSAFETLPGMYLVLSAELNILTASNVYCDTVSKTRSSIIGRHIFDVFPTRDEEPSADSVAYSLQQVLHTHQSHHLPVTRFDVSSDSKKAYYWQTSNHPVLNKDGSIYYIIHQVEELNDVNEELLKSNRTLLQTQSELEYLNITLDDKVKQRTDELLQAQRLKSHERENSFRFLLNAIPQQVWTAKPDGSLDYVNDVVSNDFGYSSEDIVGNGWQAFIHPDDLAHCLAQWMDALTQGTEYMVEFRLLFADGSYKWHLARAVPLIEQGKITLWVGTNTNIEIQKTNEQKKDEFLSIASHELKTPLTSIKAFNQLMVRAQNAVELQGYLKKSSDNILRLEKLIDDLLDVTKITAGKMKYNIEEFNFKEMVSDVVEGFKLIAVNHKIVVKSNESMMYYGDRFRLEQVLNNFLSNAAKYSPNGKKVVVNSFVEQENLIVSIQDFGIGIAKHDVGRLFERYYRGDNTVMRFEGLGLGLFIASEILKRHKGNFWLDTKEGYGSTFYFRLPISNNFANLVKEKNDSYQDESISITYNQEFNRLDLDWIGHQNMDTVKHGCLKTLEMILRFKIQKILNNNLKVVGSWSDASEWVGMIFFPMMEKKGVKSVAWIYSSDAFNQLSAKKSVDVAVGKIHTQFFTTVEEAEEWINKQ